MANLLSWTGARLWEQKTKKLHKLSCKDMPKLSIWIPSKQ